MLGLDTPGPGTVFYQAFAPFDTVALTDAVDPSVFSGGSCPAGKVCRWSDAALIKYRNPADWKIGFIADPSGGYPFIFGFTIAIDQTTPPPIGNAIWTVGPVTGTTTGQRYSDCLNYYPDSAKYDSSGVIIPHNLALLCQGAATNLGASAGDSGAPVFLWAGWIGNNARLMGVLISGKPGTLYYYSPVGSIANDLGTRTYY
jgi:hypothetical protein